MTTLDEASPSELSAIGEVLSMTRAIGETVVEFRERVRPAYEKAMRASSLRTRCKYCGCDAAGSEIAHDRHCSVCHCGVSGSASMCAECKMKEQPAGWRSLGFGWGGVA